MRLRGISKSFDGTTVFSGLDLDLRAGEVLVLLGENGAGKSTIKNILSGIVAPDAGTIEFDGQAEASWSQSRAAELGVAAIHQELSLFPNLSVAENVLIRELSRSSVGPVSRRRLVREAAALFRDLLGVDLDVTRPVESLSLGQRQVVEIVKAVRMASSVLILDEPTTSLSMHDREQLFRVIGRLRAEGFAIVHVTHFLDEVAAVGDRVAIMRDGAIVAQAAAGELSAAQIEQHMIGREVAAVARERANDRPAEGAVALEVAGLDDGERVRDVSFSVRRGEILGLAGLTGAGRTEVLHAIVGLRPALGDVAVAGVPYRARRLAESKRRGLVLVSEDRRLEQAFLQRPIAENVTAPWLSRVFRRGGWLDRRRERAFAGALVDEFDVRYDSLDSPIASLSGGNQQKVILARWISSDPEVVLLDEPTKGIDVGARAQIQERVFRLAARGAAIVVVSSDLPELMSLSDRILVMQRGRVTAAFAREEFDPAAILRAASGAGESGAAA